MSGPFPAGRAAALARLAAVRPGEYARTRNTIDGAATRLSPYLTHGLLSLPETVAALRSRGPLDRQDKLMYEFGWREYFQHVWQHRGDAIFASLHEGPLPDSAYEPALPADIREARTGLPVIDQAVRSLYTDGYLHNHARLWLASYVVHLRKVHWRAGADWLYGHLLDGDLASNHLSWQWVAGTGSHKPYLFNAENVARFAPPAWHSAGSPLDTNYEALDQLARSGDRLRAGVASLGVAEPALVIEPGPGWSAPDATLAAGRDVWLLHPWALQPPPDLPDNTLVLGVAEAGFHATWPWSGARWAFIDESLAEAPRWFGREVEITAALQSARSVRWASDLHFKLDGVEGAQPVARLFSPVDGLCGSFSRWWSRSAIGSGEG